MTPLSREMLSEDHWVLLRDTPHLVALAIAASGGSRVDLWLEHAAGLRAIRNGGKSDHPLIRALAADDQVAAALAAVKARNLATADLMRVATDSAKGAAEVLRALGGSMDMRSYESFVMSVARGVAEAAREGDFLGLGGNLVSDAERAVIASVSSALSST
jgi:hypothetical protein